MVFCGACVGGWVGVLGGGWCWVVVVAGVIGVGLISISYIEKGAE